MCLSCRAFFLASQVGDRSSWGWSSWIGTQSDLDIAISKGSFSFVLLDIGCMIKSSMKITSSFVGGFRISVVGIVRYCLVVDPCQ